MTINRIRVYGPSGEYGETEEHEVGDERPPGKITTIAERSESPEPYSVRSYIEVWCGDKLYAEFPKHNLAALYHSSPPSEQKP